MRLQGILLLKWISKVSRTPGVPFASADESTGTILMCVYVCSTRISDSDPSTSSVSTGKRKEMGPFLVVQQDNSNFADQRKMYKITLIHLHIYSPMT